MRCFWIAILSFLTLGLVYICSLMRASEFLEQARIYKSAASIDEAVDSYRKAVSWSAPGNEFAYTAERELNEWIDHTQDPHDKRTMLLQLKRGIQSSRSFFRSTEEVSIIDQKLLDLETETGVSLVERYLPRANFKYQTLGQFCFWLWISAVLLTVFWAFNKDGVVDWSRLGQGVLTILSLFSAWLWAMSMA